MNRKLGYKSLHVNPACNGMSLHSLRASRLLELTFSLSRQSRLARNSSSSERRSHTAGGTLTLAHIRALDNGSSGTILTKGNLRNYVALTDDGTTIGTGTLVVDVRSKTFFIRTCTLGWSGSSIVGSLSKERRRSSYLSLITDGIDSSSGFGFWWRSHCCDDEGDEGEVMMTLGSFFLPTPPLLPLNSKLLWRARDFEVSS
jgi:hypothetical protein